MTIYTTHIKKQLKFLLLLLTLTLISACTGLQVMIETPQPEDDFVVVCSWSSSFLKLHGGASRVKENIFVASSGDVVECGTSWQGDGPSVHVSHPLYINATGCEDRVMCDTPRSEMENGKLIVTPQSKQQYLDELISKFSGDELVRVARDYLTGNFTGTYLLGYSSVKKINTKHFKQAYEKRLTEYWKQLLPIVHEDFERSGLENFTVEEAVNNYWKRAKAYEDWER